MKTLKDEDVVRVMREEWNKRVDRLNEEVELTMGAIKSKNEPANPLITPELKVLHKSSGIRYTVDSVSHKDLILRTPEGEKFLIDGETLERDYQLD